MNKNISRKSLALLASSFLLSTSNLTAIYDDTEIKDLAAMGCVPIQPQRNSGADSNKSDFIGPKLARSIVGVRAIEKSEMGQVSEYLKCHLPRGPYAFLF